MHYNEYRYRYPHKEFWKIAKEVGNKAAIGVDAHTPKALSSSKIQIAYDFAKELECDIVYIDPPYNSRQYSRFYHLLENLAQWKKPKLYGTACKPEPENMSDYCRSSATDKFRDLISSLKCRYIVVSYNNTYNSKSSSSKNKISLEDINSILKEKGKVSVYEKPYRFFDAGKTNLEDHKELVFITKVKKNADK